MNIYHIIRTNQWEYDEHDAFIVAAETDIQAHNVANANCYGTWLDEHSSTVEIGIYNGPITEPHIILSSFNAG